MRSSPKPTLATQEGTRPTHGQQQHRALNLSFEAKEADLGRPKAQEDQQGGPLSETLTSKRRSKSGGPHSQGNLKARSLELMGIQLLRDFLSYQDPHDGGPTRPSLKAES